MAHLKYIGSTDYLKLMGFKKINDNYYRFAKEGDYWCTFFDIADREIDINHITNYVDDEVLTLLCDMIQKGLIIKVDEEGNRV